MAYSLRATSTAGNASGAGLTITKPTGTADGDLLVAVAYLESDTNTWSSVPSGWNLAGSIANTGAFKVWVYWKVASGEGANYTWTPNSSAWRTIVMGAFSGGTSPSIDVVGTGGQGDGVTPSTNQTAPSVTTTAANDLLVYAYGNFGGSNVATLTGAASSLGVSFGGVAIAWASIASAGATGTTAPSSGPGTQDYAAIHVAWLLNGGGGGGVTLQERHYPRGANRGMMRGALN